MRSDYSDYPEEYQGGYEDYYDDQQLYPEYTDPDEDINGLSDREKLALLLERQELDNEGYGEPYPQLVPDYRDVEETYEDLGPVNRVYKRQYLSFVPGSKRSGQFYPITDGWWRGITDPLAEQKRNDMEYERLMRLAQALNPSEGYYEEYKKK